MTIVIMTFSINEKAVRIGARVLKTNSGSRFDSLPMVTRAISNRNRLDSDIY